jgi:hypothetical protein
MRSTKDDEGRKREGKTKPIYTMRKDKRKSKKRTTIGHGVRFRVRGK